MKFDWNVMTEFDENGEHTTWCAKFGEKLIYIEKNYKGKYGVSNTLDPNIPYFVECKTFVSARRWVTRYQNKLEKLTR
jgi:hypothetical protein|nr:MAG TPA: hypothetical protein [Bacteriophage sp.]